MNRLQPMTIALLATSGVALLFTQQAARAADSGDTAPCRAASASSAPTPAIPSFALPGQGGAAGISGSSVRSFSRQGCAGAVLQGEHGTATVNGDRVELKAGTVYVNGVSYGSVTPAQTVEYDVARGKRTLRVDGDVRMPAE
ncbi:sugar ABC transporter ATPase [Burkholderia anthina]|nr:sugar ABC transporter ATPase [Burkholderia anthina]